jgi:hypothetical protein
MHKTLPVLFGLAFGGCGASFVANQPNHVMLANTYEPAQVRDAVATVVLKRHWIAREGEGVIEATDPKSGCTHNIVYNEHGIDIASASVVTQEQAAANLIDERCLDGAERLGKWVRKQVELPAKMAIRAEKRARRAEAAATAMNILGGIASTAASVGPAAAPARGGGGRVVGGGARSVSVNSRSNVTVTRNGSTTHTESSFVGTKTIQSN